MVMMTVTMKTMASGRVDFKRSLMSDGETIFAAVTMRTPASAAKGIFETIVEAR